MMMCVVQYQRAMASPRPKLAILVIVLIILGITAAEGWTLADVTALILAVTAAAGLTAPALTGAS